MFVKNEIKNKGLQIVCVSKMAVKTLKMTNALDTPAHQQPTKMWKK